MTRGGREHMPDCNGEGHPPEQCKELYREGLAGMRRIAKLGGGRAELEDAERTCKAANESQRKTIAALEAELALATISLHHAKAELAGYRGQEKELARQFHRAETAEAEIERLKNVVRTANDRYHRDPKSPDYDYPPFALTAWDDRVRWSKYIQKIIDEPVERE